MNALFMGVADNYSADWLQRNGGVAWAKQFAASLDPGAVADQVVAYQQAAGRIADAQRSLKSTQGNLASSWTGSAATAAHQVFQSSVDHAQLVQDTINQNIVPHLQTAQAAQQEFRETMQNVPDEKPLTPEALLYLGTKSFINYPSNFPGRVLVEQNNAARFKAAAAINVLAAKYSGAAAQLGELNEGGQNDEVAQPDTSTFNLGSTSSSSGNGAAANYRQNARSNSGSSRSSGSGSGIPSTRTPSPVVASGGGTQLASGPVGGSIPPSGTPISSPTQNPTPVGGQPVDPAPVGVAPVSYPVNSVGSEPPAAGRYGRSGGGSTNFGEGSSDGQVTGGTGTGTQRGRTLGKDSELLEENRSPVVGEKAGAGGAEGESTGGLMGEGMGGLGGGLSSGSGGRSSSRTRGRYFDEPEEEEPLTPRVRSVYEDATDEQGNSLNLLAGRRAAGGEDEDERGKRPSYSKEDGFWDSAQRIVPPVIE